MTDESSKPPVRFRKPVPGGIGEDLPDAMAAYSRTRADSGAGENHDLLAEVRQRGYEPNSYEIEFLEASELWTPDLVRRLMVVIEALESVGVPYEFDFAHDEMGTPVSFTEVKIGLSGD
jgi:hypothetical protein